MIYSPVLSFRQLSRWFSFAILWLTSAAGSSWAQTATETADPPAPDVIGKATDTWDVIHIQGVPVGYGHTRTTELREDGRTLRQTDAWMNMKVRRLGQELAMSMEMRSVETTDGQVVRIRSEVTFGPTPTVTEGRVEGDKMLLAISTRGKTSNASIPWKPDYRGFFAAEQSLRKKPIKPGERRRFKSLVPVFNQIADTELVAGDFEDTKMLDGPRRLLKITAVTGFALVSIKSNLWVDEQGDALKSYEPTMKQESFRTTRKIALQAGRQVGPDVIAGTLVEVKGLTDINNAKQVRYLVSVEDDDPAKIFPNSVAQSLKPAKQNRAELTVRRFRLADVDEDTVSSDDKPTQQDTRPNNWIQSDDERVVELAGKVVPDEKDAKRVAVALERYVEQLITEKDFSTALGTAAEVAESRQGDCTEHAVLLAALARARGIPARVVMGLVYVKPLRGFGYHMWNEVWIDGAWVPLDATRPQGGTGVGHIKLAHSNLNNTDGISAFLPVIQVVGRLKIEVADVQLNDD